MIKTIIIEDEFNVSEALKKMLKILEPDIDVVGETGFVKKAIQLIKKEKPDLVFMDIELEDGTGFSILNQLDEISFKIIFTTAYNQYAIKAFKFSAIDYLLKPINPEELQTAISKSKLLINDEKKHQELIEIFKNNLEKKELKIVLKTTEQQYVVLLADIIRLEADGPYTYFITKTKKIIVSKHIKYYQNLLDDKFIRCHQSHLVNSVHIKSFTKKGFLQMTNQDSVPVSSRKKKEIRQLINDL